MGHDEFPCGTWLPGSLKQPRKHLTRSRRRRFVASHGNGEEWAARVRFRFSGPGRLEIVRRPWKGRGKFKARRAPDGDESPANRERPSMLVLVKWGNVCGARRFGTASACCCEFRYIPRVSRRMGNTGKVGGRA